MKRKIFSKLLMGALLVASVSSFTSCKDYDDDINSLKEDLKKAALQSNLDALTQQVNSVKTTADAALSKADAASMKSALESEISAAKKAAMDEAAKGITNAATAQQAADAAKTLAQEAKDAVKAIDLTPYVTKTELAETAEAAKTEITNALANYLTADAIEKKLADLKQEIADANEEQLEEMQTKVKNATEAVNSIWSAVTNVSLFAEVDATGALKTYQNGNYAPLTFTMSKLVKDQEKSRYTRFDDVNLKSKKDGLFGDPSKKDFFQGVEAYSATTGYAFTEKYTKFPTYIVVRVSPTDAELKAEHVALIDGKGKKLGVVEVASVEPYAAYLTRGGSASGLWKIGFNLTDAVDAKDLNVQKATVVKGDKTGYVTAAPAVGDKPGLFALAINNTGDVEAAADRNIVSEYALTIDDADPVRDFDPIYNWGTTEELTNAIKIKSDLTASTNLSALAGRVKPNTTNPKVKGGKYTDQIWNADAATGASGDAVKAKKDYSTDRDLAFSATSTIMINNGGTVTVQPQAAFKAAIKYYYVARDDQNAGGSDASEINAWSSYTYGGQLNTLIDGQSECAFTVQIPNNLVKGDFIGFRLFAVNYDGTLADPDGVPFEVWVGNDKNAQAITENFTPTQNNGQTFDYAFTPTLKTGQFANTGRIVFKNGSSYYTGKETDPATTKWQWSFLKADKTAAANFDEVAYIRFTTTDVTKWKDGQTGTGTITFVEDAVTNPVPVNVINVALTKVMPTTFKAHWKESQPGNPASTNNYICYVEPTATAGTFTTTPTVWSTIAAEGYKDMTQAIQDLANDAVTGNHYQFVIENMKLDGDNAYTKPGYFPLYTSGAIAAPYTTSPLHVWADPKLVDNTSVTHAAKWYYVYTNISSENTDKSAYNGETTAANKKNNDWYVEGTPFTITYACALNPSVMKYSWVKELEVTVGTWFPELIVNNPSVATGTKVIAKVTDVYAVYNQEDKVYVDLEYTYNGVTYKNTIRKNLSTPNDLTKLIAYENSFDNDWFKNATKQMFYGGNYYVDGTSAVPSLGSYIGASVTNNSNGEAQYFTAAVDAAGLITLTPTSTTQPENAIPSTLTLKGYDAFGHVHEIAKLPFNVHRN